MKIDAGANVIGDNCDALAEFGVTVTIANIDLAVFFGELFNARLWVFDDVSEAAVGNRGSVTGERFGARIDDNLTVDGVANHCRDYTSGAVVDRRETGADSIHVIVDVRAGPHLGDVRHQIVLISSGRRAARNDFYIES